MDQPTLLERELFTGHCQSVLNPPANRSCPSGKEWALPLPTFVGINGKNYSDGEELREDIDCTADIWSTNPCTRDYCGRETKAEAKATQLMSIPYIISAVASPFLGYAVDRFGGRAIVAVVCPIILIAVHLALGYTTIGPSLPLVGQGVAYSVFAAALWPSVPFTVKAEYEGLAYGLINALQNGGLAVFPLLISAVYEGSGNRYIPHVELVFVVFAVAGVLAGLILNLYDANDGHVLNRPGIEVDAPKTDIAVIAPMEDAPKP